MWKSQAEPTHHFFGWLILHKWTLTAENLLICHWPCDWIYSLCRDIFEDATHLAKERDFTKAVRLESNLHLARLPTLNILIQFLTGRKL